MASLVACLGAGQGTWTQVMKVVDSPSWEHVFLVMPNFFADKFQNMKKNVTVIKVNESDDIPVMTEHIKKALDGKLFADVGVNLVSGAGKEHMAVLSALLKMGCGIRLVAFTEKEGFKEL